MLNEEQKMCYAKLGVLGQTEGVEGIMEIGELSFKPFHQTTAVKGGASTAYTGDGGFVENLQIKIAGNRNPGLVNQWNMYARDFTQLPDNYVIEVVGGKFRPLNTGKIYTANYTLMIASIDFISTSAMSYNTPAVEEQNLLTYALHGKILGMPNIMDL